jgi:hypothetical protein
MTAGCEAWERDGGNDSVACRTARREGNFWDPLARNHHVSLGFNVSGA